MASLSDDFALGFAGFTDLVGITDGRAAQVYAEQTASDLGLDLDDAATLEALAREAERKDNVVRNAASATVKDVKENVVDPVANAATAGAKWITWTVWGLGLVVLGAVGFYGLVVYGPKRKG